GRGLPLRFIAGPLREQFGPHEAAPRRATGGRSAPPARNLARHLLSGSRCGLATLVKWGLDSTATFPMETPYVSIEATNPPRRFICNIDRRPALWHTVSAGNL